MLVGCPAPWGQAGNKNLAVVIAVMRVKEREGERERGGGKNPLVPAILFRMPIKDNVTCKICKLLPSLWCLGPTPHSHPQLHSPALGPRALPWVSLGAQALRASGTLGLKEAAGLSPYGLVCRGGWKWCGPFLPLLL